MNVKSEVSAVMTNASAHANVAGLYEENSS
jgi:hypothetical protein